MRHITDSPDSYRKKGTHKPLVLVILTLGVQVHTAGVLAVDTSDFLALPGNAAVAVLTIQGPWGKQTDRSEAATDVSVVVDWYCLDFVLADFVFRLELADTAGHNHTVVGHMVVVEIPAGFSVLLVTPKD